jgi:MOSC domain-containing protein YiiM
MGSLEGSVVSVFVGAGGTLGKCSKSRLEFAFDGIVGDRHRGLTRKAWELTDKQPGGTERRNERQWSAVAQEDLDQVSEELSLNTPLSAGDVAANLSISGVADFSRLPRGTTLAFEGGVVLMVEEYNPPCARMSKYLSETLTTASGDPLADDAFIAASKFSRGLVGVVEVPGFVSPGERVTVHPERLAKWLRN